MKHHTSALLDCSLNFGFARAAFWAALLVGSGDGSFTSLIGPSCFHFRRSLLTRPLPEPIGPLLPALFSCKCSHKVIPL